MAGENYRIAYNRSLRTDTALRDIANFAGVIDLTPGIESGFESGKLVANTTSDGTHLNAIGYGLIESFGTLNPLLLP